MKNIAIAAVDMTSPYRGLTPYTEEDAAYFFGRTDECRMIAANLEVARLTIVYGPSGVGKSSVLRAGVIHLLQQHAQTNVAAGGRPEVIPVYYSRWQDAPLQGLTQAIVAAVQSYLPAAAVDATYHAIPTSQPTLTAYLDFVSVQTDSDLLVVLDQFEEYFLYQPDERGPHSFAHDLVQAVNSSNLRTNFLVSLREDALARLDRFKGEIPFLLDNRLGIEHLGFAAAREAVTRPLEQYAQDFGVQYTIEPELVKQILDQVSRGKLALSKHGAGVAALGAEQNRIEAPYLQLVMTRLWDKVQAEHATVLRLATLRELGGAPTIVSNYLNDTMAELPEADQAVAACFFDRLVTLGGAKIALTLDNIAQYANAGQAEVLTVIRLLEQKRLLRRVTSPTGVVQYEIFHDVLAQAVLAWQERYRKDRDANARVHAEQLARLKAEGRTRRWTGAFVTILIINVAWLVLMYFNSSLAYQLVDVVFSVLHQLLAAVGDLIGLILDAVGF